MVPHVHGHLCSFTTHPQFGRFRQATVPRSWFKTWVLTIGKAIWLTLPNDDKADSLYSSLYPYRGPNVRILIASNVIDNAAKMIFKIKQEWMHNERLQAAFPELIPDFNKTRWSDHVAEVKRTLTAQEGTYTAVGAGGSVVSQHFDHIIEDDLVYARKDDFTGMELMPSQEDIDNAIGWHKLSFSLLANPQTGCIDNVGTRWAPQDVIYYIRKFEKQYRCMELAATRGAEWPIIDNAACQWPERYDKATLENICHAQGMRIFETQYLNRPRATEDIVFTKDKVVIHDSLEEFPKNTEFATIVDLAGWGDSKGTARNVVLTGTVDDHHHMWIAALDARRMNPSEVIATFKGHSRFFHSRIYIEEIQYQRAIRHFSREEMERTGEAFVQERLPYDGRKDAKNLRIRALEPIVSNGFLHILSNMSTLMEELEFYPHSKTVDILDCMGYLLKVARPPSPVPVKATIDQFSVAQIEKELKGHASGMVGLPFDVQRKAWMDNGLKPQ